MNIDEITSILPFDGLDAFAPADQAGLKRALGTLFAGFAGRDANLLGPAYAADADWVNAFGTVKRGRDAIVAYLHGLFADQNFNDGEVVDLPASTVRRMGEDVAVVSTVLHLRGQGTVEGGTIDRANHSLHVLERTPSGDWEIVSEMFMDARQEATYVAEAGS